MCLLVSLSVFLWMCVRVWAGNDDSFCSRFQSICSERKIQKDLCSCCNLIAALFSPSEKFFQKIKTPQRLRVSNISKNIHELFFLVLSQNKHQIMIIVNHNFRFNSHLPLRCPRFFLSFIFLWISPQKNFPPPICLNVNMRQRKTEMSDWMNDWSFYSHQTHCFPYKRIDSLNCNRKGIKVFDFV